MGGSNNRKLLFNGYGVSLWEDGTVLEMVCDDNCTTIFY